MGFAIMPEIEWPELDNDKEDLKYIAEHVGEFFKDEPHKIGLWYSLVNPNFGYISPSNLISLGRAHKVRQFVQAKTEGY